MASLWMLNKAEHQIWRQLSCLVRWLLGGRFRTLASRQIHAVPAWKKRKEIIIEKKGERSPFLTPSSQSTKQKRAEEKSAKPSKWLTGKMDGGKSFAFFVKTKTLWNAFISSSSADHKGNWSARGRACSMRSAKVCLTGSCSGTQFQQDLMTLMWRGGFFFFNDLE